MKNLLVMALMSAFFCGCLHAQTLDTSYPATVTARSEAEGGIYFADGKYILYGGFMTFNGTVKPGIIKFNADGSVDNTFNTGTGPNGAIQHAVLQTDGKIVAIGNFTTFNGLNRQLLVRLNADGSVDNTFAPNVTYRNAGMQFRLLIQPDGKILANGGFGAIDGITISGNKTLFRFNSDGTKDATFTGGPDYAYQSFDMALQSDGKIIMEEYSPKG